MKGSKAKRRVLARKRRLLIIMAVAVVVVATAVTVISRQRSLAKSSVVTVRQPAAATAGTRTYVTRRVGGQYIHIDTQSGDIKPLTPQEARQLAEGLAPMLDRSTDGLAAVSQADGSVVMDLEGRFQNVTVARVNTNGTVDQSCVDNPRAAAKFFGIDRKLIQNARSARKPAIQSHD